MKTQKELNELKNEYESLKTKLSELSESELKLVTGGESAFIIPDNPHNNFGPNFYNDPNYEAKNKEFKM